MKSWKLKLLIAVFLPVSCAVALTKTQAQTQAAMNKQACDEHAKADAELNTIYQQVLHEHKVDALFIRKMRAAQRAWIIYRDAHIAALYPSADPHRDYGSVHSSCRCTALADAARKRTEVLRRWADGVPDGDVCAGSTRKGFS